MLGERRTAFKSVGTGMRYRDYPTTDCWGTMQIPYREGVFLVIDRR